MAGVFSAGEPLSCGFCHSYYNSNTELTQHQQNRGHWLTVFDRRARVIRRPVRFLDSEPTLPVIAPRTIGGPPVPEDVELTEIVVPAEEEEEEEDSEEESSESGEEGEPDSPSSPQEGIPGSSSGAPTAASATPEEQIPSEAGGSLPDGRRPTEVVSSPNLIGLTVNTLAHTLSTEQKREVKLPVFTAAYWSAVMPLRNQQMQTDSARSILLETKKLQCCHCHHIFNSPPTGSIWTIGGNIQKHLDTMHQARKRAPRQMTLHRPSTVSRIFNGTDRCHEFWNYLALAFLSGNISDCFVENIFLRRAFKSFLNADLPSRKKMRLLHQKNDDLMMRTAGRMWPDLKSCALSTDSWSSIRQQMYTGVMIHFIDEQYRLICLCLGVFRFSKLGGIPANAVNLANQIKESVNVLSLARGTVLDLCTTITTDGTAVMPAMVRSLEKKSRLCLSHQLQLLMKQYIISQDSLCILAGVASRIASQVHRSAKISDSLQKRVLSHSLPDLIALLATPASTEELASAVSDFQELSGVAKCIVKFLEPLAWASATLGAEKTPTMHSALLTLLTLFAAFGAIAEEDQDCRETVKQARYLRTLFIQRFGLYFNDPDFLISSVLCPITRTRLNQHGYGQQLTNRGIELLRQHMSTVEAQLVQEGALTPLSSPNTPQQPTTSWSERLFPLPGSPFQSRVERELTEFLGLRLNSELKTLEFWKLHSIHFPILSRVVRSLLCTPVSSLACERLFSRTGNLVSKRRNRLSSARVNIMGRSMHNLSVFQQLGLLETIFPS